MRKIALVGTSFSARDAPFHDPSWEIWGTGLSVVPRWDRWFQLHNDETLRSPLNAAHWDWLTKQTEGVIYLPRLYAEIPQGREFDPKPFVAEFGTWFFTSTISYMLAAAIQEQADTIGLWGIDLSDGTEYATQKPGARFFVQIARMRGIEVTMPPGCEIAIPGRLYGIDGPSDLASKILARMDELRERIRVTEAEISDMLTRQVALRGALEITAPKDQIAAKIKELDLEMANKRTLAISLNGALQDQDHCLTNWC